MQSSFSPYSFHRFVGDSLLRLVQPSSAQNAASHDDVSVEDTLLDYQLRRYFKTEYGLVEPPSGALPRLLAAIRAHERGDAPPRVTRPAGVFLSLYRVLRTGAAYRLVSGGLAAVMLVALLSSTSVHFLRSATVSLVHEEEVSPAPSAEVVTKADFTLATSRDDRFIPRVPTTGSDPEFYSPVELRMPMRADPASGHTAPSRWRRTGAN